MIYEHGISSKELATALAIPLTSDSALSVIIGTAPVNLSSDPSKATNVPKLVFDKPSAVAAVGYSSDFASFTLCESIFARYGLFNIGPVVLINVLDPTKHITEIPSKVCAVTLKQAKVEEEGILLDTLKVKSADGETTYVKNTDYVASFALDGKILISLIGTGAAASATTIMVSYTKLDPSKVTEMDIIGGYDAVTHKRSGSELISEIYPKLNVVPGQILAPGWSKNPNVASAILAKTSNIGGLFNAVAITDIDTSTNGCQSFDEVKEYKETHGYTDENNIICWPKVKVGNYELHYSAVMDAVIANTDNDNDGPFKSPSNENLKISGICLEGGEEVNLTMDEANVINSAGVVTAINMNGFKSWGNEMGCFPGNTDVKDRYIVMRRLFNWWDNNFKITFFSRVDDPANYRLIEDVCNTEDNMMKSYASRGKIAGGSMVFNASENPIESILGGSIIFHRYLAGYTPAKSIKTVTEFDPTLILTALQGGE